MPRFSGPAGKGAGRARREERRRQAQERAQRVQERAADRAETTTVPQSSRPPEPRQAPEGWSVDDVARALSDPPASERRHKAQMRESRRDGRFLDDAGEPVVFAPIADLPGELVEWPV
jgi:hypothetical protein